MSRSILYDWDGCQADPARTANASKSLWQYPKDAYKLYKSAEMHTKQKQKIPIWFLFPLVVIALAVLVGPQLWQLSQNISSNKGITAKDVPPVQTAPAPIQTPVPVYMPPAQSPASATASTTAPTTTVAAAAKPKIKGCARMKDRQVCSDEQGEPIALDKVDPYYLF